MSHHIDNNYAIKAVQSIEMHDVRGGPGNTLLMRIAGPMTTELIIEEKQSQSTTYVQCSYCDVIQKEFHSNCPRCGAPMGIYN